MHGRKRMGIAAAVLFAACIGIGIYGASHVRLDGKLISKNAETAACSGPVSRDLPVLAKMPRLRELDLRGADLTPEDLTALREPLPGCGLLWNVTVQGEVYPSDIRSLAVPALTKSEAEWLAALPELAAVDGEACGTGGDFEALASLSRERPDIAVSYHYPLAGKSIGSFETEAFLENASGAELEGALACLPKLQKVHLRGSLPDPGLLSELQSRFPRTELTWTVTICGEPYDWDTRVLDLSEAVVTPEDLDAISGYLPCLEQLDLGETALPGEFRQALLARCPDVSCRYGVTLLGQTFPSDAEEIDLSGCAVADLSALEQELGSFSNLKKLILSGCGQPSEALDALDRRLPETRVVWTVQLGALRVRTDDTWFMPVKFNKAVTDKDLTELKYCRDMICIDVGHMKITNCDWAADMPELQYLVIADTWVSDITPLANHKKLVFLELFLTKVKDLTPLESCTGLDDLNLSYLIADATPISHMTWLKRLWWTQPGPQRHELPEECQAELILPDALPDTEMKFHSGDSVGGGWRKGAHYYEMRDILGMFYISS